ncbi:MAG: 30S ribosomal protein S2 [Candidatus Buchananbacteria bacterium RIFCSPLOWO2_01_FULL_56_15]|uniref:Small ribosomal subunit protein uS2 n=2 Tax=Candidatus Buchananiibacteriota TaxID=1817903 RepID=A0A1G1YER1_9BACT|nr:MAG: 30S ribosomal protein S2 [Candidatus Buchananbacteria bacterium RIFCSPHIGHO2_02_FULL_56_16]OGY54827.1 MAG: 30S ribosomal protein S2 [Candidatus Buchananbacteria bacterium RIFCSPLOWO2_01_FULL_56_15]
MPQVPDLLTMLKSGVHFGHKLSKRHPKMEPFIFTSKNGFHIINIEETQTRLQAALAFVEKVVLNGGTILFLGTKKQAQPIIRKYAEACGMPFVVERWLGGTFTNFAAISKLTKKYRSLKEQKARGDLEKYTKKERLDFDREIQKLEKVVGGIAEMNRVPEAIFVCDIKKEKTAVREAIRKNVPIVALCDTNTNPDLVTYPIPSNDDAIKSIELMTQLIAAAVAAGQAAKRAQPAAA